MGWSVILTFPGHTHLLFEDFKSAKGKTQKLAIDSYYGLISISVAYIAIELHAQLYLSPYPSSSGLGCWQF